MFIIGLFLGFLCGMIFIGYLIVEKQKTHDNIKGEWIIREQKLPAGFHERP